MKYMLPISINSIIQPTSSVTDFIKLAKECDFSSVELRNDLPDSRIYGNETAETITQTLNETGIRIITINALQRFNDPALFLEKKKELEKIISTAKKIKCKMIILCPVNDPNDNRTQAQQHIDLTSALKEYADLFKENNMIGLIEPLGFPICSIRTKAQAAIAIKETGLSSIYKITHDTFHHYLSNEKEFFPAETGLIHISGVLPGKTKSDITDSDRILVTSDDCMRNREQVKALITGGYNGPVSFEAFSPEVQRMTTSQLHQNLTDSVKFLFS